MPSLKQQLIEYLTMCQKVFDSPQYDDHEKSSVILFMGQFGISLLLSDQAHRFKELYPELKETFPCITHMGKVVEA